MYEDCKARVQNNVEILCKYDDELTESDELIPHCALRRLEPALPYSLVERQ